MGKGSLERIKNQFLPCIGFSMAAGFFSAVIITVFKLCAEAVIGFSASVYAGVRENPVWLPVLLIGAGAIGFVASFFYCLSSSCRGGGIPSSVVAIRGILSFDWLSTLFILPVSALLSFFCGLPLGTEGPCVQLGTAVGDGVVQRMASKKHRGWKRYVMTGGASAGFSIAASSPITAILFAMEELHKHFSPLVMTVVSISVMTAQATVQALSSLGIGSTVLFHMPEIKAVSPKMLFAPLIVGLICGFGSLLFTILYYRINEWIHSIMNKLSAKILFPLLFACVSAIGFFLSDSLGSGHSLIEKLFEPKQLLFLIIILFLVRAITMMSANTAGVTGGTFLPTLSFGALLGAICGRVMLFFGWIGSEHYILMVVLGIVAFLGATSRIPVTAAVFAVESLGGFQNVLSVIVAITVAVLVVHFFEIEDFTDSVIESKIRSAKRGKKAKVVHVALTVGKDAFIIKKDLRDVLWPNDCIVISVKKRPEHRSEHTLHEGDIITVHYKTYYPEASAEELTELVGKQSEEIEKIMIPV